MDLKNKKNIFIRSTFDYTLITKKYVNKKLNVHYI